MGQNQQLDLSQVGRAFDDPVMGAQAAFTSAMWALSRPGFVRTMPHLDDAPVGLSSAITALLLTLIDFETPLWLPPLLAQGNVGSYLRFHTGAPLVTNPQAAMFAVSSGAEAAALTGMLNCGEDRYPDRSATMFVDVPGLAGGPAITLSGPGVNGSVAMAPQGLGQDFFARMAENHRLYPLGVDCFLCSGDEVIGLPRTTKFFLDERV